MAEKYRIERTAPTTYIDARGNVINGYVVYIQLSEYEELHEVRVPSLAKAIVEKAINELVSRRDELAKLGS